MRQKGHLTGFSAAALFWGCSFVVALPDGKPDSTFPESALGLSPLPSSDGGDAVSPGAVIYLIWGAWFFAWLAAAILGRRERGMLHGGLSALFHLIAAVALFLLLNLVNPFPATDLRYGLWPMGVPDGLGWVLVTMALAAFGFSLWASVHRIAELRRGASVVASGPYAVVRHPLQVGVILAAAVTALLFGEPTPLAGAVLLSLALIVKVWLEERASADADHRAYRRRVPMFVPFWPTRD
jgi:protein-S-isoprenylcysteine O-methyltransferase Ste14